MAKLPPNQVKLAALMTQLHEDLELDRSTAIDATAWFLGPKAENAEALLKFVKKAAKSQIKTRKKYMPQDPRIFDEDYYESKSHQDSLDQINHDLKLLLKSLRASIPLASYRNQSHMYWDITLPGAVGYFAAMLYNQNNCAAEGSPVTTVLEYKVGKDLCQMLGFRERHEQGIEITPWGHITCDGSVANGESMWAARNLKFLPVALAAAIANEPDLEAAQTVSVQTCDGKWGRLTDLSVWQLLNLQIDEVINLVEKIHRDSKIEIDIIRAAVDRYSVQNQGLVRFQRNYLETFEQATPVALVPATAHYSWDKSAALLGLGTDAAVPVHVDLNGRMSVQQLREKLYVCLDQQRPVLQVVVVMGSTEEGAVDPLAEIVELRREFQSQGLNFVIHVDGAWGGYFASMLRVGPPGDPAGKIDAYPELTRNRYFERHFNVLHEADSVTLDPHKSGFIPYPAGGLCYRNGAMRDLIAYKAPVVYHGGHDLSVGVYGIEGSKPGAAAASVYLSQKVIPLDIRGYGRLLARCLFNSKRFYAALVTMDGKQQKDPKSPITEVHVTPFQRLPAEQKGEDEDAVRAQWNFIRENFVPHQTNYLIEKVLGLPNPDEQQKKALQLFQDMGSDLSIVTYAFNYSTADGINKDLTRMNQLNHEIFERLSAHATESKKVPSVKMFITASTFDPHHYGDELVDSFASRARVEAPAGEAINFLISTTQNPWLSTTTDGNVMLGELIEVLRDTAFEAAREIVEGHAPTRSEESV